MDHPDFQIDSFGKAIGMPTIKVVQDRLLPVVERLDKGFQGSKAAGFNPIDPDLQILLGGLPIVCLD